MVRDSLTHLGSGESSYRYDSPSRDIMDVFSSPRPGRDFVIALECMEFTSLCPITGQPDYGEIDVVYVPDQLCIESKSLKLYLGAYRNHGAFHEDCVNSILDDIVAVCAPVFIRVIGDFNARGGIAIKPVAVNWGEDIDENRRGDVMEIVRSYDRFSRSKR
ncbi:7-cyano-7-deazaguanine reductase [Ferrithrix thermotolerans DSM 19514]|uniref:NADPH-dependent 7-cyano-7-deazaguanine reductase n=1 Tax=Ferrithrix thermotolerans DSM 19514 TaxID=1121881 RepID=A0A1M4SEW6_9ACTN|nr:preQ(1) synthase [Ferrithrix thermotolerans]SHE30736.1 7-cyano-7-deazaguanine reductase [Ferrithrix thermotolerans DSM 19514]